MININLPTFVSVFRYTMSDFFRPVFSTLSIQKRLDTLQREETLHIKRIEVLEEKADSLEEDLRKYRNTVDALELKLNNQLKSQDDTNSTNTSEADKPRVWINVKKVMSEAPVMSEVSAMDEMTKFMQTAQEQMTEASKAFTPEVTAPAVHKAATTATRAAARKAARKAAS